MFNNPQLMTKVGAVTPRVVIYKSESHKLHQAFKVRSGDTIVAGQPVMLNTDGTISPYLGTGLYLGIATTNSETPAYNDDEVTVMCSGFAVIYGLSNGAITPGAVKPASREEGSQYVKWATDPEGGNNFIALNSTTGADELIQILVK